MGETLSVRASEELQARFKEFSEKSGFRNQGEFVSHLLTMYAAQETGVRVPTLEGAITAIKDMADKACKILIGTGETIILNHEKLKEEAAAFRHEADARVSAITAVNESLKIENEDYQAELAGLKKSYAELLSEREEQIKNLEQSLSDKSALNDVYRKELERLEAENERQKALVAHADSVMAELNQLRYTMREQILHIEGFELDKEKALRELTKTLRSEMEDLQFRHNTDVGEYEKKLLDKEKEHGELEKAFRDEMNNLQAQHAALVNGYEQKLLDMGNAQLERDKVLRNEMADQQSKYAAAITEYENKVKSLLVELEHRPIAQPSNE